MGRHERRIGRIDREGNGGRLLRWRRIIHCHVERGRDISRYVLASKIARRFLDFARNDQKNANGKHQRKQRSPVAIAGRKIRRFVQGDFYSAWTRAGLTRLIKAASVRSGMDSSASWQKQFPLSRALRPVGIVSDHFWQRHGSP